jgi:hypothetical protein
MTVADPGSYGVRLLCHEQISVEQVHEQATVNVRPTSSHITHYETQVFVTINGRFRETVDGAKLSSGFHCTSYQRDFRLP